MIQYLQKKFFTEDVWLLLKLSLPLIFSGVVESSISFFSTLFLAHLGQEELAAGGLVTWTFATLMVILWGTLTAVSVLVSRKYGEKNDVGVSRSLRDGLLLALLFVPPAFLLLWNFAPIFLLLGQSPAIVLLARPFLHAIVWGLLPDFVMLVLLQFLIGLGHSRTSMVFVLLWVPLNIFCNYVLIFGKFGFPRLEIAGIGWGLTASYWITTVGLCIYILFNQTYRKYLRLAATFFGPYHLWELLRIGLPMGLMFCVEIAFFLALTLSMGLFGHAFLAANQIIMQYVGQMITVVFAIAQGITVRMGHLLGADNFIAAKKANYAGIFLSVVFMILASLAYWFLPEKLIALDLSIHDPKNFIVIHYAKQFFVVAAFFQLLESIRFSLFGALRAFNDTHFTLFVSIIGFWFIALPLGHLFSRFAFGAAGLWFGMLAGASCSVILLYYRFKTQCQNLG